MKAHQTDHGLDADGIVGKGTLQSMSIGSVPEFLFEVEWGGEMMAFTEVTGLAETDPVRIDYRHDDSAFLNVKMPGMNTGADITMRRGHSVSDDHFWNWYSSIKMNTTARKNLTIRLLNERGRAKMKWEVANAWPIKIVGIDLENAGNEVAIDTLVIAHEGAVASSS
ncbi:MAG: phage tail protein [Myxococcales bacterium]|nr:phage tail protein [Myxococcales bacterium]